MSDQTQHLSNDQLQTYLDQALDPPALLEVENHLESCPACQAEYQRLKQVVFQYQGLPELALDVDFSPLVIDQLKAERKMPSGITWTLVLEAVGAGAVIALLIPVLQAAAWLPKLQDTQNQVRAAINIFFTQLASSWLVWWAGLTMEMDLVRASIFAGTALPDLDFSPWILILAAGGIGILINYLLLRARPARGSLNHQ